MKNGQTHEHVVVEISPLNFAAQKKTRFLGDVLRLVTGTVIAQAIGVLAAPILARLFAPDAFGVAALFTSLTGIFGVVVCLRYELAIVLPDNDREAANLLAVSLFFSVLIALFLIPLVWFGGPQLLKLMKMSELRPYLWLVPVAVFIFGVFTAFNNWNTRTKHYVRLSAAQVTSTAVSNSTSLCAGFLGHATGGAMITASVAGQAISAIVLGGQILRDHGKFFMRSIRWNEMLVGIKRHKKFPLYSSWSALLNSLSWQLPVLMLGIFFSPTIVGFYALGYRILQLPMSLIGGSVGQVFFQRAAEAKVKGVLSTLVARISQKLFLMALLPCLILTMIGKDLYVFIFGTNWAEAGIYTQILAPWALVCFVASPLSLVYIVLEKQNKEPVIQGLIFITRLLAVAIGAYFHDARLAILIFSIFGVFSYLYLLKVIFNFCHLGLLEFVVKNLRVNCSVLLFAAPLFVAKLFGANIFFLLLIAGIAEAAFVFIYKKKLVYESS